MAPGSELGRAPVGLSTSCSRQQQASKFGASYALDSSLLIVALARGFAS